MSNVVLKEKGATCSHTDCFPLGTENMINSSGTFYLGAALSKVMEYGAILNKDKQ